MPYTSTAASSGRSPLQRTASAMVKTAAPSAAKACTQPRSSGLRSSLTRTARRASRQQPPSCLVSRGDVGRVARFDRQVVRQQVVARQQIRHYVVVLLLAEAAG